MQGTVGPRESLVPLSVHRAQSGARPRGRREARSLEAVEAKMEPWGVLGVGDTPGQKPAAEEAPDGMELYSRSPDQLGLVTQLRSSALSARLQYF